ncbi:MAG TPA: NAD-dependent epimerase/dehydratase family protein [Planctomicrobium sp.]|nr:NAD-dependent epimerase/dehydratase family protein [Planctomicrobium sp.]
MRVLVTGGAGFIGSHLVDALLHSGHDVAVIDDLSSGVRENLPSGVRLFELDIRDESAVFNALKEFRPDAVSHQAAQMSVSRSVREPGFDAQVNILGLLNVMSAAIHVGAGRFVFASSGGVLYGETELPAGEETPPAPISPYGVSKLAGEHYLRFFTREHGISSVALRYANVYGERQNPHGEAGVVAIFCTRLLKGDVATINGDGKYVRDYVHVSDVVAANIHALTSETKGFEALNVGTGIGTDVNQLASRIHEACQALLRRDGVKKELPALIHGPARAGDLRSNLISYQKANTLWGWSPQVLIDQGVAQTAEWFGDHVLRSH